MQSVKKCGTEEWLKRLELLVARAARAQSFKAPQSNSQRNVKDQSLTQLQSQKPPPDFTDWLSHNMTD